MAFGIKKYKLRLQLRPASSRSPRRVTLVAQRKMVGAKSNKKKRQLNDTIAAAKNTQEGSKIRSK